MALPLLPASAAPTPTLTTPTAPLSELEVQTRMATDPTFRQSVREIRGKIRAAAMARAACKRRIKELNAQFRATIQPHVAAIKDAQQNAKAEVKVLPEAVEVRRKDTAAKSAATAFKNRENVSYWAMRNLFPLGMRSRRGIRLAEQVREFRVRI